MNIYRMALPEKELPKALTVIPSILQQAFHWSYHSPRRKPVNIYMNMINRTLLSKAGSITSFRALDKKRYLMIIRDNFCKFCIKTYIVTPHLNHLIKINMLYAG